MLHQPGGDVVTGLGTLQSDQLHQRLRQQLDGLVRLDAVHEAGDAEDQLVAQFRGQPKRSLKTSSGTNWA